MEKEPVTKFDLDAAFKALDELDIPAAQKGIAANKVNLTETFANARNNKLKTELLVEDYYDINDQEDLEQAQADREEEVAKAKLARIEKIVDLDAESPEDLLPSYVGKVIIQCPQCMTLFYKDPADIEASEDDPSIVNINEVCQHCGNASGYNVIGKVDAVAEDEASNYEATEEPVEETSEDELDLDFEEPTEEVDAEGTGEAETTLEEPAEEESEDELNLDFTTEEEGEEEEEEKKEESLNLSKVQKDAAEGSELETENHSENLTLNESGEETLRTENRSEVEVAAEEHDPTLRTENKSVNLEEGLESPVAYFLDCSGSWREADWAQELDEIKNAQGPVSVFYFSDKLYDNPTDAFKGGLSSGCVEIIRYAKAHPETTCIVRTDDDYKGQGGLELETLPNVELRLRKVGESLNESEEVLTEASVKELDDKLKAHNEYIDYLKKMIAQEEDALKSATNDEVKAAIQRRLDAFNDDLNKALPEAVKDDLAAEELPTPEEANAEETSVEEVETTEETTESVNKSENTAEIAKDELPDARTLHEEVITVTVDTDEGREPIVTVTQTEEQPVVEPVAEPVCVGPECEAPIAEPCVGPECDVVPPVVADIPAVEVPAESPVDIADGTPIEAPVDAAKQEEPITPEEKSEEDEFNAKMAADANTAIDELASEFGIEAGDASEEKHEDEEIEEPSEEKNEDINIVNNDSPGRADNRTTSAPASTTSEPVTTDEGILSGVGSIVNGLSGAAKEIPIVGDLLASDEAEKKDAGEKKEPLEECNKTEQSVEEAKADEGLGLFGIGDVNVNLDASGQNNAVGFGGGHATTEAVEDELKEDALSEKNWFTGLFQTKEHRAINKLYDEFRVIAWSLHKDSGQLFRGAVGDKTKFPEWSKKNILGVYALGKKDVQEAMKVAATFSKDARKPLADVYGMKGGVANLLYTFKDGKQLTEADYKSKFMTPSAENGFTGEKYNEIHYVKSETDYTEEGIYKDVRHTATEAKDAKKADDVEKKEHDSNVFHQLVSLGKKWVIVDELGQKPRTNTFESDKLKDALEAAKKYSISIPADKTVYVETDDGKKIYTFKDGEQDKGADYATVVTESFEPVAADLSLYEDIDEISISKHITESLTKVYENVDSFEMTDCSLTNGNLIIEGTVTFKSTKTRPVKYIFKEAVIADEKVYLRGINESLSTDGTFILECSAADNKLVAEGLAYNYTVDDKLVEGYTVGK